jgi:hypothetical protein
MRFALSSIVLVAACASTGPAGSPASAARPDQTVRVIGSSSRSSVTMAADDPSTSHTLAYSVEQVWLALPSAFDALGIPVRTLDPAKRIIGNPGVTLRHRLKDVPLSRYLDCGGGQMGPNADDYDVRLMFDAQVLPTEGGAKLTTTIGAVARPANYAQEYSECSSKGTLESRFVELVQAKLAR